MHPSCRKTPKLGANPAGALTIGDHQSSPGTARVQRVPRRKPPLPPIPKITFPRRRLTRWEKLALIVGPPVLIIVIVVGIIVENRAGPEPSATATAATTPVSSPSRAEDPSPSTTPAEQQNPGDGSESDPFPFGSTAHFTSAAGSNNIPLEFTVSAPTPFTPSKDAVFYDATSSVGAKGDRQETNVYFTVTITNTATTQAYDPDFVFSEVHETGDDANISEVHDGDVDGFLELQGHTIKPGKPVTVKDGYSVKSADTIVYQLKVDGLAGRSFYFAR